MKIRDKVLIVEDEQNIKNFMSTILAANGFDTLMAGSAKEALSMISSHCPDLIILDLGLPDMDGMEVLKQVRAWSSVPVIVVSARTHEGDKVAALDLGADDYIEKPFGTSELLARIRTAIRHTRTGLDNDSIAQSGKYTVRDLTIDYDKHHVLMRGEDVHLTLNEFKIVALLGKYAGKVLTTISSSARSGAPRPRRTIRSCASTWRTSAARSRRIPPRPSTYSPRSAWATGCSRMSKK